MIFPLSQTGIPEYLALAFRLMGLTHQTRLAWKLCDRLIHRLNFERLYFKRPNLERPNSEDPTSTDRLRTTETSNDPT
jgi:hypothetical protein